MSDIYWEEKIDFWKNKTADNPIYESQKAEVVRDLLEIIQNRVITRVIDVGGYRGIVGELLKDAGYMGEYINLDFPKQNILKPWDVEPGDPATTLAFTSLVLICVNPDGFDHITKEMQKFADGLYFYEEYPKAEDGKQVNSEYGGKWSYKWTERFDNNKFLFLPSQVNDAWVRIFPRL